MKFFKHKRGKNNSIMHNISLLLRFNSYQDFAKFASFIPSLLKHFKSNRDISLNSVQSVCILENMDMFFPTHSANFIPHKTDHNSVM